MSNYALTEAVTGYGSGVGTGRALGGLESVNFSKKRTVAKKLKGGGKNGGIQILRNSNSQILKPLNSNPIRLEIQSNNIKKT